MGFVLHPRLMADTAVIVDWSLSRVLLMNDKRFPWVVLVPRRPNVVELFDLDADPAERYDRSDERGCDQYGDRASAEPRDAWRTLHRLAALGSKRRRVCRLSETSESHFHGLSGARWDFNAAARVSLHALDRAWHSGSVSAVWVVLPGTPSEHRVANARTR